jgi:hypothetical protein
MSASNGKGPEQAMRDNLGLGPARPAASWAAGREDARKETASA